MNSKTRFLTLLAIIFSICVPPASSQDCSSMVRDDAGLFGSATGEVTSAAEALQNAGAQVYVRTFPTTGNQPTAVRLEHFIESQCPDWQAANGSRKENLVAIVYADRDANGKHSIAISTGGRIDSIVPPTEIDRIRAQVIIAELKRGHSTKAFADGLNAIRTSYAGSSTTTASQPAPAQQTIPVPANGPPDHTGLWFFLILVGLAVFGWIVYVSYRENERRRAARLKAQQVYNSVTAQINAIDENKAALRARFDILPPGLPANERHKLETALAQINKTYDEACADFGTKRTSDLEKRGLSVEEYDALRETYQAILDKLNTAADLVSETSSHLDALQAQIEAAPKKVQEAQAALNALPDRLQQVKQAGFRTETYEALAAKAQNVVNDAHEALNKRLIFEALALVDQAGEILQNASVGQKLPEKKAELDNGIATLKIRIEKARDSVRLCKPVIDRMDTEFAAKSFESVIGNGSQATEHINWCDRGVPMAADFASMEKQDWQKAADIVAEANAHLDRVDSLVSSITAMEQSLNTARAGAPKDMQDAEQDLRAAQEYIAAHKNDLHTETGAKLAGAEEAIAKARDELQKPRPDYFEAVNSARKAHAVADEVLASARTEYEAAQRLKEKAASALRDATSRVTKAREYIEDHHRYVKETAKFKLQEAEQYLASAQKCNDSGNLDGTVNWAGLADEAGKVAYKQAREDAEPQTIDSNAYTLANSHYAPSITTIFVNDSSRDNYVSVGAASSSSSSDSSWFSSLFGGGSDSSSSFSFGGGSDSSSSFSSGGGSDSGSSW